LHVINNEKKYFCLDNFYTYSIMGLSGIGFLIARRGGYTTMALGASFFAAPAFALYQKR
jgi:hypothetical protein